MSAVVGGAAPTLATVSILWSRVVRRRPVHVLFFLADDLGWADVDWHREPNYPEKATPRLDRLRSEGIELDRTYAFKYCAPSRAALLSGRHPVHVTVLNSDPGTRNLASNETGFAGIARSMTSLASLLRRAGYRTHQVGKWGVGMASTRRSASSLTRTIIGTGP